MGLRALLHRSIPRNVLLLGVVSLLTDFSSEMIYPLLPAFFTGLVGPAAAAVYIGVMDGLAESVSSLLKIVSGRWSDRAARRKPLTLAGYVLSSLARPLLALATTGWQVVALRFVDRIGKGLRTSPRDALIAESVPATGLGLAFSFHRMMDHAGAVAGPLAAIGILALWLGNGLLWQHGGAADPTQMGALRGLFALALLPGLASVLTLGLGVRERPATGRATARPADSARLSGRFYLFLAAVTLFALGNSSDLFLVFYLQTRFGLGLGLVLALWISLHLAKVLCSLPGGRLADRYGRRPTILAGWLLYAGIYLLLPRIGDLTSAWGLLLLYGGYYGLTEGAERALVADLAPAAGRGRAFGLYHGAVGLAALPASLLFGVFWAQLGPHVAFAIGAGLALAAVAVFVVWLGVTGGRRG